MNKLFTKITSLALGAAMMIGVGVAVGSKANVSSAQATVANWAAANGGWSNQETIPNGTYDFDDDTNVKISFTKGGSNTAYYTTGGVRVYNGGNFTVTSTGGSITSIALSYTLNGSATLSADVGTLSGQSWTGNSATVVFSAGTEKHVRLASLAVTYSGGGDTPDPEDPLDGETGTINFGNAEGSTMLSTSNLSGDDSLSQTWNGTDVWPSGSTKSYTNNATYTQIGASNASKRITSISFEMTLVKAYKVTAFSVKTGGYSETSGTATLKVGDTTVGSGSISSSDTVLEATDTTQEGTVLSVILASTSGMRFKLYYISYSLEAISETTDDTTTSLSVTPNSWSGYNTDTINLSSYTVSCTTTASDDGYIFQGIGSGAGDNFVGRDADKSSFIPKTTDTRLQWKAKYPQTAGGDTYLYAYVSLTVTADTVSSVSASVADKTYYANSKLSASDFTISATWSHAGVKSVTSGFTWTVNGTADGALSYGNNTVVVTYENTPSSNIIVNAQYAKGSDYSVPLGVTESITNQASYINTNIYVVGYISEWFSTYAYISDTKTATGDNSSRLEVYSSNINYINGDEDDYVTGTKVIVYGKLSYYSKASVYELVDLNGVSPSRLDVYIEETETPTSVTVTTSPTKTQYNAGNTFDPSGLVVTLTYPSRTEQVTYSNATASRFAFNPGLDHALTGDDTTIQVTIGGVSVNIAIEIDTAIHTNSVTLKIGQSDAPASLSRALDAGDLTLTAVLDPVNSEDAVTWASSDDDLAVVLDGEVTFGDSTGVVTITATSGGKSDSIEITLTDPSDAYLYSIAIVEGAGVVKDYYNDTDLDTTGLSITATFKSNNVAGWSKDVENYTTNITWSLDRADGFVIARYNNSETIYDLMEVTIHNTDKPKEFVLSYSGETQASTEASYDLGDYITVPTNWTVTALKNSCTNNVGLNTAGQFKLYSNKTGGDGNMITVESDDSAVNIKSVTLSITGTCTHEVTKTGGVVVSGSGETYQINASSFSVQNTHTGSSTNTLSINSITVAYGYVDSFVSAQTFEQQFIKRDIDYPETTPTGVPGVACLPTGEEGHLGYFDSAVTAYNALTDAQSRIWFATRAEFANARERFIAWGLANRKTVTFDSTTGAITVTPINASLIQNMFGNSETTATTVIIIIVSVIGVSALGGFFFLRKRKEI